MSTVHSSSNSGDGKLEKGLLVNKILCHTQAEGCILYLFDGGEPTLQRAYSTGNMGVLTGSHGRHIARS